MQFQTLDLEDLFADHDHRVQTGEQSHTVSGPWLTPRESHTALNCKAHADLSTGLFHLLFYEYWVKSPSFLRHIMHYGGMVRVKATLCGSWDSCSGQSDIP